MTVTEKVKQAQRVAKTPKVKALLENAAYFCLGFAFSFGSVLGELRPFGISFTACAKKKQLPFCALGAIAGAFAHGFNAVSLKCIAAILLASLFVIGSSVLDLGYSPLIAMGSAFLSAIFTGIIINLKLGANLSEYALTLGESLLSAGGAYFFYRALNANYKRLRLRALPLSDISCIVISLTLLTMNVASVKVFGVTPARVLCVAVMLTVLRFMGDRWGLIFALCFGFSLSLFDVSTLFIVGTFAFSVMVASLFSGLSCFASGFAFICSIAFFCIASDSAFSLNLFIDSALGALIFVLLPSKVTSKLEELSESGLNERPDGTLRQSLVLKLRFAGAAMAAISESVEQVSDKIDEITRKENRKLKDEISEEEYASREIILEKTNQIRRVASDQFFSISGMLEDLAFEFDNAEIFDSAASSKIRRLLGEYEIYPQSISVVEDKYSRIRVEILLDSFSPKLESGRLKGEIGKICSRYFDDGRITNFKEETMLSFHEKPNYISDFGFAQHSADSGLCGDTVKVLNDNKGHAILIISDGMGKGSRAALDGAMGAGLLSKLLNSGFGFDSALKVVNSALLVKSNDESLATLDVAVIDLFTGKCEILKAGAPASYIIKGKSLTKCELFSMPAGILRGIEFARRTAVLSPDDTIVLMSDGISDLGEEWVCGMLRDSCTLTPQKAADYILEKALEKAKDGKLDDMSVIVAKLIKN